VVHTQDTAPPTNQKESRKQARVPLGAARPNPDIPWAFVLHPQAHHPKALARGEGEPLLGDAYTLQQTLFRMLTLLQDRPDALPRHAWPYVLALIMLASGWRVARAQAPSVEPVAPPSHVVVHDTASPYHLADLGPHFADSWISTAIPALASADETPPLVREVVVHPGDGRSEPQARTTYVRADDGRLLERHIDRRRDATWQPAQRTRYHYRDGVLVGQHTDVWLRDAWHPDRQVKLLRDATGRVNKVVHQAWRGGQWIKEAHLVLSAADTSQSGTAAGSMVQHQIIRATRSGGTWQPTTRITFTIAEAGRHIVQRNEAWMGTTWENSARLVYMYDGAGYPIEKSLAVWTGQHWADGSHDLYDYHVRGKQVEQRTETWVGSRRIRTERVQFEYATPVQKPLLGQASFE
jgi:hypothetical protein